MCRTQAALLVCWRLLPKVDATGKALPPLTDEFRVNDATHGLCEQVLQGATSPTSMACCAQLSASRLLPGFVSAQQNPPQAASGVQKAHVAMPSSKDFLCSFESVTCSMHQESHNAVLAWHDSGVLLTAMPSCACHFSVP